MSQHEKIDYIEFQSSDIAATKTFFSTVFNWSFTDYGPDYCAFHYAGIEGGFYKAKGISKTEKGAILVVFYSSNIDETQAKIEAAGGKIINPIFTFPGGRRFHFADPNGNEFAVWSDK